MLKKLAFIYDVIPYSCYYEDPKYGSISLDLDNVTEGIYFFSNTDVLVENGVYLTNNTYYYPGKFDESYRSYFVQSIWDLTDRGSVLFHTDVQDSFAINGGWLNVQEHQNFVDLEGLVDPRKWPSLLDQFNLYHDFERRKSTYLDIFEKIIFSQPGYYELEGNSDAVYDLEKSWFTAFMSHLKGSTKNEKISSLKSLIAANSSSEFNLYINVYPSKHSPLRR